MQSTAAVATSTKAHLNQGVKHCLSSQHIKHHLNLGYNRLLTNQLHQDHIQQDSKPVQINKVCFLS